MISDEALAFLLVCGAGSSTAIGSAVVYKSDWIKVASKEVLGASLGLSAGVMLYVSFVEILQKAFIAFEEAGYESNYAYLYGTLCFFCGIVMIRLIDKLVHYLSDEASRLNEELEIDKVEERMKDELPTLSTLSALRSSSEKEGDEVEDEEGTCGLELGSRDRESESSEALNVLINTADKTKTKTNRSKNPTALEEKVGHLDLQFCSHSSNSNQNLNGVLGSEVEETEEEKNKKLHRMGLFTALAIGIHNFPEGLATFVATIDNPAVGVALAVAIAIHNIPEGLCVSVPIYYATGDRHKAFLWGVLSGASEVLAAGLGWLILAYAVSDAVYGILFGLVAGMMVSICLYELLPTARRYDTEDKFVTTSVVVGMVIMSISLVAFQF